MFVSSWQACSASWSWYSALGTQPADPLDRAQAVSLSAAPVRSHRSVSRRDSASYVFVSSEHAVDDLCTRQASSAAEVQQIYRCPLIASAVLKKACSTD